MSVFIPCLNPDAGNNQVGSGIQIVTPQSIASGLVSLAGTAFPVAIGETVLYLNPITAIAAFAINYQFWANLFGLGETRIDREKAQIQDVYTSIFTYLHVALGVPIRDGHALDFPSDGVQKQFDARPEIAALVPQLMQTSPIVTKGVFAHGTPTQGQLERTVNQFLANASINNWPVQATVDIWQGLVEAANPECASDPNRWLKNPAILRSAGIGAALLQYIPLNVLLDMSVGHHIGDPLLEELVKLWASNPSLVSFVEPITGLPWQSIYTEGRWALPPYGLPGFSIVQPLIARDHILPILQSVKIQAPTYPTFTDQNTTYIPIPQPPTIPPPTQQPSPTPTPQPTPSPTPQPTPTPTPQPEPTPPGEIPTLNIPPRKQDGTAYSTSELDYACTISRLAYGNAPLTDSERAWAVDPLNAALLEYQLLNPQCQIPLVRQQPYDPPTQGPDNCRPQPPTFPGPQPQPQPNPQPIPPPNPQPGPGPGQQPCPPDCLYQIDQVRQQVKDCCDELHQHVLPRIIDLETWVYDLERRVPGPKPPLPYPGDGPNDPTLFPDPPDITPPQPEPPPNPPGAPGPTALTCQDVINCIVLHCDEVNAVLNACKEGDEPDPCAEGIAKWGKWAECWLRTFTPTPTPQQGYWESLLKSGQLPAIVNATLKGQTPGLMGIVQQEMTARTRAALAGDYSEFAKPTFPYQGGRGYIFEKVTA